MKLEKNNIIEASGKVSVKELKDLARPILLVINLITLVVMYIIVINLFVTISPVTEILLTFVYSFLFSFIYKILFRKYHTATFKNTFMRYLFNPDGFIYEKDKKKLEFKWNDVLKVSSKKYIYIIKVKSGILLIPKSFFKNKKDLNEFEATIPNSKNKS